jgi:hypothetical protein
MGPITLGQMQAKVMTMLEVACRRCERRGAAQDLAPKGRVWSSGARPFGDLIAADCGRNVEQSVVLG